MSFCHLFTDEGLLGGPAVCASSHLTLRRWGTRAPFSWLFLSVIGSMSSVLHAEPFSKVHLVFLDSFCISILFLPASCRKTLCFIELRTVSFLFSSPFIVSSFLLAPLTNSFVLLFHFLLLGHPPFFRPPK